MQYRIQYLIAAVIVVLGTWSAGADAATGIVVEHAWARASPKGAANGIAYLRLVNNGLESDRLVGATSPVSESIQFHEERNDNGVSKMRGHRQDRKSRGNG